MRCSTTAPTSMMTESPTMKAWPLRILRPQTILAYALNGKPLDVGHGAPVRLRFERQLGYKHAKYVMRIELVQSLTGIGSGKGGYWEDQGYEWCSGYSRLCGYRLILRRFLRRIARLPLYRTADARFLRAFDRLAGEQGVDCSPQVVAGHRFVVAWTAVVELPAVDQPPLCIE